MNLMKIMFVFGSSEFVARQGASLAVQWHLDMHLSKQCEVGVYQG